MILDVIVLVVILISALVSFLRGVIREILTILGVIGGLVAAYYGGPILNPYMEDWLGVKEPAEGEKVEKFMGILTYDMLAEILSYGLIFIVVVVILSIISHLLAETVRAIGLGPIDRTLGVIFGIARGILLIAIVFIPVRIAASEEKREEWFKDSKSYFYVDKISQALIDMVPDAVLDELKEDAETVEEGINTREKLQNMNVLKKDQAADGKTENDAAKGPGYTEEFREEMDKLFENKPEPGERQQGQ